MTTPLLKKITAEALDAFWAVLAKRYPQTKTGDLSPLTAIALEMAAEDAVEEWITRKALPTCQ